MILNLPYKVKKIEKKNKRNMTKFSIATIVKKEDEKRLNPFLNLLDDFKNNGGEVCILSIDLDDNIINIAKEWGCKIEDGTSFLRFVDEEMSNLINSNFREKIIQTGDSYIDYSGARNYLASTSSNDMILMIDLPNYIKFDIDDIEKIIETHDNIKIKNKPKGICEFYNRKKYTWYNIVNEILIENDINELKNTFIYENFSISQENKKSILTELTISCFLNSNENISQLFAIELLNKNYLSDAYDEFQKHLSICTSALKKSISLVYLGDYFLKENRDDEALDYYYKAYLNCSSIRSPLYRLGQYFYFRKIWDKTIFFLEGCLSIPKNDDDIDDFMYKDGPYSMLYVAYWWSGNIEKGKYYFDKAIEKDPYNKIYIDEALFHYNYKGNNIRGSILSFQELQYLYKESKKVKKVLEIYPRCGRGTDALLNGCDGIVTIIMNSSDNAIVNFLESVGNPGNIRILNMKTGDAIKLLESENEKFDMIFFNRYYDQIINDYNFYIDLSVWEKFAKKLICGSDYKNSKELIDKNFEVSGVFDNLWYKNLSSFEKTIIYKKKNNYE